MAEIKLELEHFQGPLDLLLHLIEKDEIDIRDIPLAEITDQYMEYLGDLDAMNLDVASEFLIMATKLMEIKAQMLLPSRDLVEEAEIDLREELVEKLLEYKKYRQVADELSQLAESENKRYPRLIDELTEYTGESPDLEGLSLGDLLVAFERVMQSLNEKGQVHQIDRGGISVQERVRQLTVIFNEQRRVSFVSLFAHDHSRYAIVVTFLAVLELVRLRRVSIHQDETFQDILITWKENADESSAAARID